MQIKTNIPLQAENRFSFFLIVYFKIMEVIIKKKFLCKRAYKKKVILVLRVKNNVVKLK